MTAQPVTMWAVIGPCGLSFVRATKDFSIWAFLDDGEDWADYVAMGYRVAKVIVSEVQDDQPT